MNGFATLAATFAAGVLSSTTPSIRRAAPNRKTGRRETALYLAEESRERW